MNISKIFCIISIAFILPLNAQNNTEKAIGLRIGNNDGLTYELSYQRFLSEAQNQRMEFGLGLRDSKGLEHVKLVGLYEYVSKLAGDYRWYVGTGAGVGAFETDLVKDNFGLINGVVGIEHSTPNVPILFSLDFRPEYAFNEDYSDGINFDIGLSIRIQF